jgi:hypothetical protein
VIVKSLLAIAVGLFVSFASIQAASADVLPCGCRSGPPGPGPETDSGDGGDGGASGGGGKGGSGGSGGATNSTTTTMKSHGLDRKTGNAVACTEYAASPASNPSGKFALGMGAVLLIPLARRRTKKKDK